MYSLGSSCTVLRGKSNASVCLTSWDREYIWALPCTRYALNSLCGRSSDHKGSSRPAGKRIVLDTGPYLGP